MRSLNLSENKLKEYDLKDFDNLDVSDLSKNEIEGELNLAYRPTLLPSTSAPTTSLR